MSIANDIQKLYMGYLGRAAEETGLNYWVDMVENHGWSVLDVALSFADQPEYAAIYGANPSRLELVSRTYNQLFGREFDLAGLNYWVYGDGKAVPDNLLVQAFYDGASVKDREAINNKCEVADYYTATHGAHGTYDKTEADHFIDTVTRDHATVDQAKDAIDALSVNTTFTLTDHVVKQTTADIVTAIDPVITKTTMWGYNPHAHGETGVDNTGGSNTGNQTNEGAVDGGVPLADLVSLLTNYLNHQITVLNMFSTVDILDAIENITIAGANDPLQGHGFLGEDGELADGYTLNGDIVIDEDGNAVAFYNSSTGEYTGSYEIIVTLSDGNTTSAQVALSEQQFEFIHSLLFDAEGNTRLFQAITKTWPKVELTDQEGNVIEDANGDPILVNLYQYTAKGVTTTSYIPIVLTPTINNGGTVESDALHTTRFNDLIVAGRLELLHQAYIDGGAGYNTLEVDAKGTFAQPLELLHIQQVNIENLPNVYTTDYGDGSGLLDNSTYPDLATGGSGIVEDSVLDLSRAVDLQRIVITESDYNIDTTPQIGDLTVVGIRNGAVARFEGGFTQDVTLHYSEGRSDTIPLTVELLLGQVTANLNFVHDTDSLHLVSLGGSANSFGSEDVDGSQSVLGGRLTNLIISGNASLYIRGDLDSSFQDATPVTIDASTNEKGVNLSLSNSQNVTFIGSQGNDIFIVTTEEADEVADYFGYENDQSVTIIGGPGDNHYEVGTYKAVITTGDGDNNYDVDAVVVDIATGDGNNHFEILDANTVTLAAGDGDNHFEVVADLTSDTTYPDDSLDTPNKISITAGDGANAFDVEADLTIGEINIVTGRGGNTIDAVAHAVTIDSGNGVDTIRVLADVITIDSAGGDTITIGGFDPDYVPGADPTGSGGGDRDGALVTIHAGADATIILGDDSGQDSVDTFPGESTITLHQGSVLAGQNITLVVNTYADVRGVVSLAGVSKVVMDDDAFDYNSAVGANNGAAEPTPTDFSSAVSDNAMLTLTAAQFLEIGAENFSVDGSMFSTHAFVKIIVTSSTSLTALGADNLSRNIDLVLELNDGVTLTMTAQQLHERVAANGIILADDYNTDLASGKVVIQKAGLYFDPWNITDTTHDDQGDYGDPSYVGGSLSNDFDASNVKVSRTTTSAGYNRPEDEANTDVITIDSGDALVTQGAFSTWVSNLELIGDHDITFTGAIDLGADFVVDFSSLQAEAIDLTLSNFQDVEQIRGNSINGYDATIYARMMGHDGTGAIIGTEIAGSGGEYAGLVSSGVRKYIVVDINDGDAAAYDTDEAATIYLCDSTQDLEVIGLRGNWNATLNVNQVQWGVAFELQGDGSVNYTTKANGDPAYSNVGILHASFQWEGAPAVVNINNQGVALTTRSLHVEGIVIDNAKSIEVNVADGNAVIESIGEGAGFDTLDSLDFNSAKNIRIVDELAIDSLDSIDAAGVLGDFAATLTGEAADAGFDFVASAHATTLTLDEVTLGHHSSLTAAANATFTLVIAEGVAEQADPDDGYEEGGMDLAITPEDINVAQLSAATLANVDKIVLSDLSEVVLTQTQAQLIGLANIVLAHPGLDGTLSVLNLGSAAFDATTVGAGVNVEVTLVDAAVTLNPATNLTGVDGFATQDDTVVTMTATQFLQLAGAELDIDGDSNFHITGATQAHLNVEDFLTLLTDVNNATGPGNSLTVVSDVKLTASILNACAVNGFELIAGAPNIRVDVTMDAANLEGDPNGGESDDQLNEVGIDSDSGVKSNGVATYVVTKLDATADDNFFVCNDTVGLQTLGLRGNGGDTINFSGIKWGVNFLMEGDGAVNWTEVEKVQNEFGGDWNESNIGSLTATFFTEDNPLAVVNINNQGHLLGSASTAPGAERKLVVDDITINNVDAITINVTDGDAIIHSIAGDDASTLTLNAVEDLTITDALATILTDIDATGVHGAFAATLDDMDEAFTITTGANATLTLGEVTADQGSVIDGTAGVLNLVLTADTDLSDATLASVESIVLKDVTANSVDAVTLTLTVQQATTIGLSHITVADNDEDVLTLNIVDMNNTVLNVLNLTSNVEIGTITMAAGAWTLAAGTNLTDATSITIPEGGTLTLTADQFMQLAGDGTIISPDTLANVHTTVHITGLTQAHVDAGFTLDMLGDDIVGSVELAESVVLGTFTPNFTVDTIVDLHGFEVIMSDDQTLTLVDVSQLGEKLDPAEEATASGKGLHVSGGTNTTLVLSFTEGFGPFDRFDASGWAIDIVKMPSELVDHRDIELFEDMASDISVRIYDSEGLGVVLPIDRTITIEEGVTVGGFLVFNDYQGDSSVVTLELTMEGGATIDGNIRLTTVGAEDIHGNELTQNYFDQLTINSHLGVNDPHHHTLNIINGDISPLPTNPNGGGPLGTAVENNLLDVVINADTALQITGDIVFNSVDEIPDHPAALNIGMDNATLVVNGTAAVTLGGIDTQDDDLDSVTVTNNSSAVLTLSLDDEGTEILEDGGHLTLNGGTVGMNLIIEDGETIDLSAATLSHINHVFLFDADLTLTAAQLLAIGQANIVAVDGTDGDASVSGSLSIVEYHGEAINTASLEDADIDVVDITFAANAGVITVNPAANLTGVASLIIPDGTTVNMTAAQFLQLTGAGSVANLDDNDPTTAPGTLNITDLGNGQAAIDLSEVAAVLQGAVFLASSQAAVVFSTAANLDEFAIVMTADGQSVTFSNHAQADGRVVTEGDGVDDTEILIGYDNDTTPIVATGYGTDQVWVYNGLVEDQNVETLLYDLASAVEVVVFKEDNRVDPQAIEHIYRTVTIQPDVTVDGELVFNDPRDNVEVAELNLNLRGGSVVDGDLRLPTVNVSTLPPTLQADFFDTLNIDSTGSKANDITGIINAMPAAPGVPSSITEFENDLLNVNITASQALHIEGITFSSISTEDDEATATLNVDNSASVTIDDLSTGDDDVDALVVNHEGTGSLTIGLSSTSTIDETDEITINGSATGADNLVITGNIDLSDDTLVEVDNVLISDDGILTVTLAQFNDIGAGNFHDDPAAIGVAGQLNIIGLDDAPFYATDIDSGLDAVSVTMIDADVTLDAATNLTGIDRIVVHAGHTLTLTAAQFQQLKGTGTIVGTGLDEDGNVVVSTDFTVKITDLTQADVDQTGGLDLTGITAANQGTITLADDTVVFRSGNVATDTDGDGDIDIPAYTLTKLGGFAIELGATQAIVLSTQAQADERDITGAGTVTLGFTAYTDPIDVDGYLIPKLNVLHELIENADGIDNNVEVLLTGLGSSVMLHVIHTDELYVFDWAAVQQTNRVVYIEEGVTIDADVLFTDTRPGHEVATLTLNLMGDAGISGDLDVTAILHNPAPVEPPIYDPNYFQTLTINSEGSAPNFIDGEIGAGTSIGQNNLVDVVINADQDLTIGEIHFQARDENDDAIAQLTIDGAGDVTIGDLSTQDDEVDGLEVTHTGEGAMTIRLDGWDMDDDDSIVITGSTDGDDNLVISDAVDLSDDIITDIDSIEIENGAELTLTLAQYNDVGAANIHDAPAGKLNIIGLDDTPFDATIVADNGVDLFEVTMIDDDVTLNDDTDLTDVDVIYVQAGRTLTLTAAQFQQLAGHGSIVGVDGTTDFTVKITDLTQADVDAVGGLDLSGILSADQGTITLAQDVILRGANANAIADNPFTVENEATPARYITVLGGFAIALEADQQITLSNETQADGRYISGGGTVWLGFSGIVDNELNVAHYAINKLEVLDLLIEADNYNVEDLLQGLASNVEVHVFDLNPGSVHPIDPASVLKTVRTVVIDEDTTLTETNVVFSNLNAGYEVAQLNIVLDGNATIDGNINLGAINHGIVPGSITPETPAGIPYDVDYFQKLTITSQGDSANEIDGVISGLGGVDLDVNTSGTQAGLENNLLDVTITASQDLEIDGITFTSRTDDATAELVVNGAADVIIGDLSTGDDDVDTLEVTHTGTGDLTIGLNTLATIDDSDQLTITGKVGAEDTLNITSSVGAPMDLSTDTLVSIDAIVLADESVLILSQAQIDDLDDGTGGLLDIVLANTADHATLNVVGLMGTGHPFDASLLVGTGIDIGTVTIADVHGVVTLDAATDLTGVGEIIVLAGTTLYLTAAQFQQLDGSGIISGNGTVNITDLTQADVGDGDDLDLSGIIANQGTITLDDDTIILDPLTDLGDDFAIELANGQVIGLSSQAQADGREITGTGATSTVQLGFDTLTDSTIDYGSPDVSDVGIIDVTGYDVSDLRVLDKLIEIYADHNVETLLNGLISDTLVTVFEWTPGSDNMPIGLDEDALLTSREVVIEAGTTVDSDIAFNDLSPMVEVTDLTLTLDGNATIDGNLNLFTTQDELGDEGVSFEFLQWVQLNSTGAGPNEITGFITGTPDSFNFGYFEDRENNVLDVRIDADATLHLGGIEFSARSQPQIVALDLNDAMTVGGADEIVFDGVHIDLSAIVDLDVVPNGVADEVRNAIITQYNAAAGTNWLAFNADFLGDATVVYFVNTTGATIANPVFTFVDDNAANVLHNLNFNGEVTITNQELPESGDATLTVTGDAAVVIDDLNTDDEDVVSLTVDHTGTGALTIGLSTLATIDESDHLTINGKVGVSDTLNIASNSGLPMDLSNDDLVSIDAIVLANNSVLTLSQAQIDALDDGAGGLTDIVLKSGATAATLHVVDLMGTGHPFDATLAAPGITIASITIAAGVVTLDPATDLTGVGKLIVPDGTTLNLTAAQFQQLLAEGTIDRLDDGNGLTPAGIVNITDLTQTDIGDGADFDLTGIDTDLQGTITLQENVVLDPLTDISEFAIKLANGQVIGLSHEDQADGRVITGTGATSTVQLGFDTLTGGPAPQLDCSHYTISDLWVLDRLVELYSQHNVEWIINDLSSNTLITVFDWSASEDNNPPVDVDLDAILTHREVVVQADTVVDTDIGFTDLDHIVEVADLTMTLSGNSIIEGNLNLFTTTDAPGVDGRTFEYLQWVEINSIGDEPNAIEGTVTGTPPADPNFLENNVLDVRINAAADLNIGDVDTAFPETHTGGIVFSARNQADVFVLDLNDDMIVNGADSITFDGDTIDLAGADTAAQVRTAILAQFSGPNWIASAYAGDATMVVFTSTHPGVNVDDVVSTDIVFTDDLGAAPFDPLTSPDFDGEVIVINQGGFANEIAELTVTGEADVVIGNLDTSDAEVVGLIVDHNGTDNASTADDPTGALTLVIDGDAIDSDDDLTINGSANGADNLVIFNTVDLSDDTLSEIDHVKITSGSTLTLNLTQFNDIGGVNIDDAPPAAILNVVDVDGTLFDVTTVDPNVDVVDVTIADLDSVTLNTGTNLTGVDRILVHEGTTLTMTAEQFAQLQGLGTIQGVGGTHDFTVNITGLTQDIVDGAHGDADFILTGITAANQGYITLQDNSVTLATTTQIDAAELAVPDELLLNKFAIHLAPGQRIVLSSQDQADGRHIETIGNADTTNVNLLLMIDNSSNLTDGNLANMKAALIDMINAVDALADNVAVRLMTFSPNDSSVDGAPDTWLTADQAKAAINDIAKNILGTSQFEFALQGGMDAFNTGQAGTVYDPEGTNMSFFLTDAKGEPAVQPATQAAWEQFLRDNNMVSEAIGFDLGIDATDAMAQLQAIAYDGTAILDTKAAVPATNSAQLIGLLADLADEVLSAQTATVVLGFNTLGEHDPLGNPIGEPGADPADGYFTEEYSLDTSHYHVTDLWVYDELVENYNGQNVEVLLDDLASTTNVTIFEYDPLNPHDFPVELNAEAMGVTHYRHVIVDADTTVEGQQIVFNDIDDPEEMTDLILDLTGGSVITGNVDLLTKAEPAGTEYEYLDTVIINSTGTNPNQITGDLMAGTDGDIGTENNLLDVTINATGTGGLNMGDIVFTSRLESETFNLVIDSDTAVHGADTFTFTYGSNTNTVTLTDGDDAVDVAAAIHNSGFWNTTYVPGSNVVTFTAIPAGVEVADIAASNFTFTDVFSGTFVPPFVPGGNPFPDGSILGATAIITNQGGGDLATAELHVTGSEAVTISDLNTADDQVDSLHVLHEGTGSLTIGLSTVATVDGTDDLDIHGSATATDTLVIDTYHEDTDAGGPDVAAAGPELDLSDDILVSIDAIRMEEHSQLRLDTDDFLAIGATDILGTAGGVLEELALTDYNGQAINTAALAANGVKLTQLVLRDTNGIIVVDPGADLSNIYQIIIPDGTTLSMTAAQFQTLPATATIVGDGGVDTGKLNITGLTQANINAAGDFDLSGVDADVCGTLTLAGNVLLNPADDLSAFAIDLVGFDLGLSDDLQAGFGLANGRAITGVAGSSVTLGFDTIGGAIGIPNADDWLNTSGWNFPDLYVVSSLVDNENPNIEDLFQGLVSGVHVHLFDFNPAAPTSTSIPIPLVTLIPEALETNRVLTVEAGTEISSYLAFTDLNNHVPTPVTEVTTLALNLGGNTMVWGDIDLSAAAEATGVSFEHFRSLTIASTGAGPNAIVSGMVPLVQAGDITGAGNIAGTVENNLLTVNISAEATAPLSVEGDVVFTSVNDTETFVLTLDPDMVIKDGDTITFQGKTVTLFNGMHANDVASMIAAVLPVPQHETFTLNLNDGLAAVAADTMTFAGTTVTFVGGENQVTAAVAIAAAVNGDAANPWSAVALGDGTINFTRDNFVNVTDVTAASFVFSGAGTNLNGAVTVTNQGYDWSTVVGLGPLANTVTFTSAQAGVNVANVVAADFTFTDVDNTEFWPNPIVDGTSTDFPGTSSVLITNQGGGANAAAVLNLSGDGAKSLGGVNTTDNDVATLTIERAGNGALSIFSVSDDATDTITLNSGLGTGNVIFDGTSALGTLHLTGGAGDDTLTGGANIDTISGGAGNDTLTGNAGADSLSGGAGNDILIAQDIDSIDGGADNDTVRFAAAVSAVNLAEGDLSAVENVVITNTGNAAYDFSAQSEALTITGNTGNDTITGGSGADSISAGAGDDIIVGAQNDTLLDGGTHTVGDTLRVGANFDDVNNGQIVNIETVALTATGITLNLGDQTEDLTIVGWAAGSSTITGGSGTDTITGGTGADTLSGGAGVDHLTGGLGADILTGGGNGDVFVIADADSGLTTASADILADFVRTADWLDLDVAGGAGNFYALDVNTGAANEMATVEAAVLAANAAVGAGTSFDGTIRYIYVFDSVGGVNSYLVADTNLGGVADYAIQLSGVHTAADLLSIDII